MISVVRVMIVSALALPLISVATVPSLAQESKQQIAQQVNCANPQTTREMNICAEQEYQAADQKLNSVYRKLRSRLSGQQRQRLTNAQLAWIKFRDANCVYERSQFEGSTIASPVNTYCLARMTQQRAQELDKYLLDKLKT